MRQRSNEDAARFAARFPDEHVPLGIRYGSDRVRAAWLWRRCREKLAIGFVDLLAPWLSSRLQVSGIPTDPAPKGYCADCNLIACAELLECKRTGRRL